MRQEDLQKFHDKELVIELRRFIELQRYNKYIFEVLLPFLSDLLRCEIDLHEPQTAIY